MNYVRVMADYCSTGLWNENGENVDVDDYALSTSTIKALKEWCHLYEHNDDWKPFIDRKIPAFDIKSFSEKGLEIAKMVKLDLPQFKVVYFDEYAFLQHKDSLEMYEYEVN